MDVIPSDLIRAALGARDRLSEASRTAAAANAGLGNATAAGTMARAARAAIFVDALTAAMHARLEELKSVAK